MAVNSLASERAAILDGVHAADAALARWPGSAMLRLFIRAEQRRSGEPRFEMLRDYAELRRALLSQGRTVSAASLAAAGFTSGQIVQFDDMIAEIPTER